MKNAQTRNILRDAEHWRQRAEEARTVSEIMIDAETQRMMLGVAESYDRLANFADRMERDLSVAVSGETITVSSPGTAFSVTYCKHPNGRELTLVKSWVSVTVTSPAISEFRSLAQQIATDRARELGWFA